ncbi:hypothetical protein CHS0354_030050 [Potamilus streckersoni]|uniref:Uncharacterized protein n=1 Tax=Potamilus streckersoni TaxID=2493646 RepID=A0AAE0RLN4_9BIVA|nr:hypothetical protein CHS0354_030050 [Potamilus streckersoni]
MSLSGSLTVICSRRLYNRWTARFQSRGSGRFSAYLSVDATPADRRAFFSQFQSADGLFNFLNFLTAGGGYALPFAADIVFSSSAFLQCTVSGAISGGSVLTGCGFTDIVHVILTFSGRFQRFSIPCERARAYLGGIDILTGAVIGVIARDHPFCVNIAVDALVNHGAELPALQRLETADVDTVQGFRRMGRNGFSASALRPDTDGRPVKLFTAAKTPWK